MTSWIYVFSKFTPEALLFEALLIFILLSSYAAFWVLRKRRLGAVDDAVPSSVVKLYLNELIGEAHEMRTQLFGLLSGNLPTLSADTAGPGPSIQVSGDAGKKLSELEQKMAEQAAAIEKIMTEKAALEKELKDARAKGATSASGNEDLQKLQDKCSTLEARLAEYSVIEDDLANLKRLQQENTLLKTQLSKGGAAPDGAASSAPSAAAASVPAANAATAGSANTAMASPSTAESAPASSAENANPSSAKSSAEAMAMAAGSAENAASTPSGTSAQAGPEAAAAADSTAGSTEAASGPSAPSATDATKASGATPGAASAGSSSAAFEGLVDEVEKSLQSNPSAGTAEAATAAPPAATPTGTEKTDEDLIAEFEKMLNS